MSKKIAVVLLSILIISMGCVSNTNFTNSNELNPNYFLKAEINRLKAVQDIYTGTIYVTFYVKNIGNIPIESGTINFDVLFADNSMIMHVSKPINFITPETDSFEDVILPLLIKKRAEQVEITEIFLHNEEYDIHSEEATSIKVNVIYY